LLGARLGSGLLGAPWVFPKDLAVSVFLTPANPLGDYAMSFRIVAYGECPRCGQTLVRTLPADIGVCDCKSATEVKLEPAIVVWGRTLKLAKKVAGERGISLSEAVLLILRRGSEGLLT